MDNRGPVSVTSLPGRRYLLIIVDDYTRHPWFKFETRKLMYNFLVFVQNQFINTVKIYSSDSGIEFQHPEFYAKFGILHETSWPLHNEIQLRKESATTF